MNENRKKNPQRKYVFMHDKIGHWLNTELSGSSQGIGPILSWLAVVEALAQY